MTDLLKIKSLCLADFRGCDAAEYHFSDDCEIAGPNGSGKTTVMDAFFWLLWDKSSKDASLNPKPSTGAEECAVEGVLVKAGRETTLKKVYKERRTKRRGEAMKQLTGHEVDRYIDDVPVSKSDYDQAVKGLFPGYMPLLCSPERFPRAPWREQRTILMSLVSDEAQIDFEIAEEIGLTLGGKTPEELMKSAKHRKYKLNSLLQTLPARIDENRRQISDNLPPLDLLRRRLRDLMSDGVDRDRITALVKERREAIAAAEEKGAMARKARRESCRVIEKKLDDLREEEGRHAVALRKIYYIERRTERLRDEYRERGAVSVEVEEACPLCGSTLSAGAIEQSRNDAKRHRAESLKRIKMEAMELSAEKEKLEKVPDRREEISLLEEELAAMPQPERVEADIESIDEEIQRLRTAEPDTEKIAGLKLDIAAAERTEGAEARIEELKKEESDAAEQFRDAEALIVKIERFLEKKAGRVEADIGHKFRRVGWRLFEPLVKDGLKPTCECTLDGVAYSDLSTSQKIIAGCDIIMTLAAELGAPPCWIDEIDLITKVPAVPGQRIALRVDAEEKDVVIR